MTPELRELCSAAAEGTLTPEQSGRLEELVAADPAARRFLVEHLNLHAALAWAAGDAAMLAGGPSAGAASGAEHPALSSRPPRRNLFKWAGWAVAACLLVGLGIGAAVRPATPREFARLADAPGCKWGSGTLPTAEGSRLGAGRLRLAEGVARIVFDNGAELRLEGPAELELTDGLRVALHAGRLVARCPDTAHGFVVDTPTAGLTDHGTEFGVSVGDGRTDVQVFDGRVDVSHPGTGRTEALVTGGAMRFTPDAATAFDPRAEGPRVPEPAPALAPGRRVVTITTATGAGRDAYVIPKPNPVHQSDVLILVKSSVPSSADYFRKGYAGFDLAPLAGLRVESATLTFTQVPTGMGFASEVPDSTFGVYGVTDDRLTDWTEDGLSWANAPANAPGGSAVDPGKTVRVGEFRVPQGVQTGAFSIQSQALTAFLGTRTRPFATFILVRDTPGSGRQDYVHGFAGREHPTLPPPTLKVVVAGK